MNDAQVGGARSSGGVVPLRTKELICRRAPMKTLAESRQRSKEEPTLAPAFRTEQPGHFVRKKKILDGIALLAFKTIGPNGYRSRHLLKIDTRWVQFYANQACYHIHH